LNGTASRSAMRSLRCSAVAAYAAGEARATSDRNGLADFRVIECRASRKALDIEKRIAAW